MITDNSTSVLEVSMEVFLTLLRAGWDGVGALAASLGRDVGEFQSDWAQANWEAVVEAALSSGGQTFLEPYGDGADCNGAGSRVWKPEARPTHAVHCMPLAGALARDRLVGEASHLPPMGVLFDRFAVATSDGWYAERPPFDHVLGMSAGREMLFRVSEVRFILREVNPS